MTLGILLLRRSHLKPLASVITASLRRGHQTVVILDGRPAKPGDALSAAEITRLWPDARVETVAPWWLDALIGLDAGLPCRGPWKMIGVDSFFDAWARPPRRDTVLCYSSQYHLDVHANLWKDRLHVGGCLVGWLPADHKASAHAQRPRDAAVFFSLKLREAEPWRQSREGRRAYKAWAHRARDRAHQEGLAFVVKTRRKNGDPWWLRWLADEYLEDVTPQTSLWLCSRARWVVHFESGAVYEAALMGAYSMALAVPQPHLIDIPGGSLQYGGKAAMHDWPGVSRYGLEGVIPRADPDAQAAFLEHFVGKCDGRAGERVIDVAEASQ